MLEPKYCDECKRLAEWIERLPAFTARYPKYKCDLHKPVAKQYEETYSIYLGNKAIGL